MFYTVFNTFKWDYLSIVVLTSITTLMKLSGPFLINPLITYVRDGDIPDFLTDKGINFFDNSAWPDWLSWLTPTTQYGISLALLLVLT